MHRQTGERVAVKIFDKRSLDEVVVVVVMVAAEKSRLSGEREKVLE